MIPITHGPAHSIPEYCIRHSGGDESNIGRIRCLCEAVDTISLNSAIVTEWEKSAPDLPPMTIMYHKMFFSSSGVLGDIVCEWD